MNDGCRNYLVCSMYKEVASLASSILKHHDNNILTTIATQQDMLESAGYGPPFITPELLH
jgi:hypothetical protein